MTRHWLVRCLRISALGFGLLLCVIAVAAIPLGFGEASDFVFFRLLGIPRKTTFYLGAILMLAGVVPNPRFFLSKFPAVDVKEGFISEAQSTRPLRLLCIVGGQLILAAGVALIAFFLNRRNLLGYIDGQYLLTLGRNQSEFMAPIFGFSTNPLQGLGDLWFFTNTRLIPELSVSRLVSDSQWQRVAVHTLALLEIFCATFLLAYWLYASPGKAAASAWLAVLMISPITYPGLIYNISYDAPELATLIALPLLIVPLWARTGRGSAGSDLLCMVGIALLVWLHFIAFSLFTALVYPFLAVVGLVFLVASWQNKNEFWRKLLCASALIAVLALSGLPQALVGITMDTAFYLFPEHLMRSAHELSDGSILLRPSEPVGVVVAGLGVASAIYQVRFAQERQRWFASAVLILVVLVVSASVFYAAAGGSGARPIYYEYVLWPVYAILAVPCIAIAWNAGGRLFASVWPRIARRRHGWQWLVLPLAAVLILHGRNFLAGATNERPNIYPPKMTPLVEYLRGEIALAQHAPFRGRVVTMTGQNSGSGVTWDQMFELDMQLIRSVGNDHRTIGLWYYSIPTLIEFNHTIPPFLYALAERYLAYDSDLQVRTLLNMRQPDIHVLRLLGVRYVITDGHLPTAGTRRVSVMALPESGGLLAVDEVPNPNLGVSPTTTLRLASLAEALDWIGKTENDFERAAILDGPDPGPLLPASDIEIRIEQDGLAVRARSNGRSLVVIPFQFSRCLRAISHAAGKPPELRRANLALTGLLFDGDLDVTIAYRQGPFQQPYCRLDDLADDTRLMRPH